MFNSIDYIVTARHYAKREGASSVKERILKQRERLHKKNSIAITIKDIDQARGKAVEARIEFGQWIGDCECGGAEFVDPQEPIFFCFSCGNRENSGVPRPVAFPEEATRLEIERLVLERPVDDRRGLDDLQRAHMSKPLIIVEKEVREVDPETQQEVVHVVQLPLTRSWDPSESIADLIKQNEPVKEWQEHLKQKE